MAEAESKITTSAVSAVSVREGSDADIFIVEPTSSHTHTFILLHGLGSNGEKFGQEFLDTAITSANIKLQSLLPHTKFIFPTAKKRRSSAFGRSVLRQWFDIASLSDPSIRQDVQYKGLAESATTIRALIESEVQNVSPSNIILGGLSQGCAMSLSVLLSLDFALGGFMGMSGWLPFQKDIHQLVAEDDGQDDEDDPFGTTENEEQEHPVVTARNFARDILSLEALDATQERSALLTPVFIGHGEADPKISSCLGESAAQTLRIIGMDVTWNLYAEQGHWYKIPNEIDDILDFLEKKTNVTTVRP